uniref:Uncharacterized protein n=2 Tax=unclassified Caudoviricetes TaxID=2788787 RepID=A0A8S5UMV6_9CAUD|nr:MAG TPA: hypothetical protein [Siphoviridae sp. ctsus30]DAF95816.1 MAG TPA: hypothetical protein [Siphoviridae sp. ctKGQ3]
MVLSHGDYSVQPQDGSKPPEEVSRRILAQRQGCLYPLHGWERRLYPSA